MRTTKSKAFCPKTSARAVCLNPEDFVRVIEMCDALSPSIAPAEETKTQTAMNSV